MFRMAPGSLPKLRFSSAEELCTVLVPGEEAEALLKPRLGAADFLAALVAAGLVVDAIRYLAVALPRREAVWWACATRRRMPVVETEPEQAAWQAAEAWVYEPTELNRRATYAHAERLRFETAGAYAALGVFWSGGSLAPPESAQHVPPGDGLTGSAVGASVMLRCVPGEARTTAERQRLVLEAGFDIARGGSGLAGTAS
ncbi:hypothetical protein OPKNFCMD_3236 [Methylobacterium crusticola]|uniref:Uncharacterized protein n=1 Tax=Methylobacterium crusticola TaxID=1697972 RepID=A0ABQ4QZ14_9HYPH|nr:hypothetical protein [Methylobacterium crusticola]GJD50493.1 hypothetical protein OPKNFCMD_3236 [Methylobacterium crusticola]